MTDRLPYIEFEHVHKAFGRKVVINDVSFDVMPGETVCILGRSGVGDPGAGAFAAELFSGVSHESIVARLLGSQEYIARQQTLIVSAGSGAGESFAQYETQQQQAEAQAQAEENNNKACFAWGRTALV